MTPSLQPALPKAMYVDQQHSPRSATWCCSTAGSAWVGWQSLGLDTPGRLAVVDVVGESILVT